MAHTYGTAVRFQASGTNAPSTANPASFTINCPAGTTVLWLGMVVSGTTARAGGSPTYNGVAMTAGVAKTNAGGIPETNAETWYMLNPPTGSAYTISVPNSGALGITYTAATAAAASGFTTVRVGGTTGTGTALTSTANSSTGAVGDIIFAVVGNGALSWPTNPTRTGTQIHDWDTGSRGHGSQYTIAGTTAAVTMSWTHTVSEDYIVEIDRFTEQAIPSSGNYNFTAFFD